MLPFLVWIASIGLMYVLGARIFTSARLGFVTAGVFALTPLVWHQIQDAPASLRPLPLVLGWLLAVDHFGGPRGWWWGVVAGLLLGLGLYSSHAAAVMMPLYLLLTIVVVLAGRTVSSSRLGPLVAAFSVAAGPFALSLVRGPETFRNLITAYHLYDAGRFNVLQGAHEMASWVGVTDRAEVYYDYFNPTFLFLTGRLLLLTLVVLITFV